MKNSVDGLCFLLIRGHSSLVEEWVRTGKELEGRERFGQNHSGIWICSCRDCWSVFRALLRSKRLKNTEIMPIGSYIFLVLSVYGCMCIL